LGKNTLKAWSKTDGLSTLRMDEVVLRTLVTYLISFVLTALSRRVILWAKSRIIQRDRKRCHSLWAVFHRGLSCLLTIQGPLKRGQDLSNRGRCSLCHHGERIFLGSCHFRVKEGRREGRKVWIPSSSILRLALLALGKHLVPKYLNYASCAGGR